MRWFIGLLLVVSSGTVTADPLGDAEYWNEISCHGAGSATACVFKEGVQIRDGSRIWITTLRTGAIPATGAITIKLYRKYADNGICQAKLVNWNNLCLAPSDVAATSRILPTTRCMLLDHKTECPVRK